MCACVYVCADEAFNCKSSAPADLVILVDGSWSIGRINFRLVRTFLENLVRAFQVDQERTRVGLAQYSGDPRIEWHLNTHSSKEAVMEAAKNLPYKGGNTLTGTNTYTRTHPATHTHTHTTLFLLLTTPHRLFLLLPGPSSRSGPHLHPGEQLQCAGWL